VRLHLDEPAHADPLVRLNEAWTRACFRLEDFDHAFARDPMRIVRDGGALLTLARGRQVVGGCALLREDPHRFRLARMVVAESERRRGLGTRLMQAAMARAAELGATRMSLLSHTRLAPAVRLYRRHGYVPTHEGPHPVHARCDLIMERTLEPASRPCDGVDTHAR
jgi:putative acetyltransferase